MTKLTKAVIMGLIALTPMPALAQYDYYSSGSFGFNQNNYPDISGCKWKKPESSTTTTPRKSTTTPNYQRQAAPESSDDTPVPTFPLPYARDRALSNQLRTEFLINMAGQRSASDVQLITALTTRHDFVQTYAGLAKLQGLDSSTPEGMLALFYGQTWAIANKQPLPLARQYQAIAKQFRDTNARDKVWNRLNNRDRQTVIERLAYPLVIQKINYETYRSDGRAAAIADMATKVQAGMLKTFQINMQATKLTPTGFDPPAP